MRSRALRCCEAALALPLLLLLLLPTLPAQAADGAHAVATTLARFQTLDVRMVGDHMAGTAFQLRCEAVVRGPAASRYAGSAEGMSVFLFFDGNDTWVLRFTPDAVGPWSWEVPATCANAALQRQNGTVECTSDGGPNATGGIMASPSHPRALVYETGAPFLSVGYEVDWLWALPVAGSAGRGGGRDGGGDAGVSALATADRQQHHHQQHHHQQHQQQATLEDFLGTVQQFGFNHLLVSFYANFSVWNAPLPARVAPKVSPTLATPWTNDGSPGGSDADRTSLHLDYFRHWDDVMRTAQQYGMIIHMMCFVGNKGVQWPTLNSTADSVYWEHVLARYAAFPNIVLDVSKEAGGYNIGDNYTRARIALIHARNAHRRPVTAHSGLSWSNACDGCNLTMATLQSHYSNHTDGEWYAEMKNATAENPGVPIFQAEFMYEAGALRGCNGSAAHDCTTSPDDVTTMRMVMWDLYMAGGSGAWYNCDTAWDVISIAAAPSPGYVGVGHLVDFFTHNAPQYQLWHENNAAVQLADECAGVLAHCLSNGTAEHVVHVRANCAFTLNVTASPVAAAPSPCEWPAGAVPSPPQGEWFDPATGARVPLNATAVVPLSPAAAFRFAPPPSFSEDVVLHVRTPAATQQQAAAAAAVACA